MSWRRTAEVDEQSLWACAWGVQALSASQDCCLVYKEQLDSVLARPPFFCQQIPPRLGNRTLSLPGASYIPWIMTNRVEAKDAVSVLSPGWWSAKLQQNEQFLTRWMNELISCASPQIEPNVMNVVQRGFGGLCYVGQSGCLDWYWPLTCWTHSNGWYPAGTGIVLWIYETDLFQLCSFDVVITSKAPVSLGSMHDRAKYRDENR